MPAPTLDRTSEDRGKGEDAHDDISAGRRRHAYSLERSPFRRWRRRWRPADGSDAPVGPRAIVGRMPQHRPRLPHPVPASGCVGGHVAHVRMSGNGSLTSIVCDLHELRVAAHLPISLASRSHPRNLRRESPRASLGRIARPRVCVAGSHAQRRRQREVVTRAAGSRARGGADAWHRAQALRQLHGPVSVCPMVAMPLSRRS